MAVMLSAFSCHTNNCKEQWQDERNMIEEAKIVSIDDSLPPMHAFTHIFIYGDTMIFHDYKSTDRQFLGYDLDEGKCLGWFGIFGNGPGEIANFGTCFFDPYKRIFYGMDGNQWNISGFELDKALKDSTYRAFTKASMAALELRVPVQSVFFHNDSTILCHLYEMNENWTKSVQRLGRLDIETGKTEIIEEFLPEEDARFGMDISFEDSLVWVTHHTNDRIDLLNLDGKLIKTIYGPDYHNPRLHMIYYFYDPVFCGDKICVVYHGKYDPTFSFGRDILMFDLEGNYLKTLRCEMPITDIAYHEKTDRLYVCTNGDPQFGYIQL